MCKRKKVTALTRRISFSEPDTYRPAMTLPATACGGKPNWSSPLQVSHAVRQVLSPHRVSLSHLLAASIVSISAIAPALAASINLSDLDGSNGFVINGIDANDYSGSSVSGAGDVNGDGVDDLIIGAYGADPAGHNSAGESYVVFGGSGVGSTGSIDLSALNGSNGFIINGIADFDRSGNSVSSAGDINGDGVGDLIIGAPFADPNGDILAGESYVVYGGVALGSFGSIDLSGINGTNGFTLNGIDAGDVAGTSVSTVGDVNGDGLDDLIIGAEGGESNGFSRAGESYVVFGGTNFGNGGPISLSVLNGSIGFILRGIASNDYSGGAVSGAGDVNGDGVEDLIIGANSADTSSGIDAGQSYVVFGGSGIGGGSPIYLSSLNGSNGFVIHGIDSNDRSGRSVSAAGDINGDGVDDLIVGADYADPNGNSYAGESYVVFGGVGLGSFGSINLSGINGSNGFVLNGADVTDNSGGAVSGAGDFNGDGVDDLIIGASGAGPLVGGLAGESYVVFGGSGVGSTGSIDLSTLNSSSGFVINGMDIGDRSGWSVSGAGDINDDGLADVLIGAPYANPGSESAAGVSYVVFGVGSSPVIPTVEANLVSSCLAGNGRVDLNIVNTQTVSSVYRLELQGQSPRQRTLVFEDWGRMPITGRPDGTYTTIVKRDGVTILSEDIEINCDDSIPTVSSPEVSIVNACRAGNGQVFFQMVNPTSSSRAYVIEFDGVANRSTTAAPFGQALRGTTGRPDGVYNYRVRTGSTIVDSGAVEVGCD